VAVPIEGTMKHNPAVFKITPETSCALDGDVIQIQCHSFLAIYVQSAYFGRYKDNVRNLCNKTKGK